jgi:hypothetical protein
LRKNCKNKNWDFLLKRTRFPCLRGGKEQSKEKNVNGRAKKREKRISLYGRL